MSGKIHPYLLEEGAVFVFNDAQANEAFQRRCLVTLKLEENDLIIVEEVKTSRSRPQAEGLWLGLILKAEVSKLDEGDVRVAQVVCVDWLQSQPRVSVSSNKPLLLYATDRITVVRRHGRPVNWENPPSSPPQIEEVKT